MEQDPGCGTVYSSKPFMETLQVTEGDPVEIVGPVSCVVQARQHPNPWVDTRMIAIDQHTLDHLGVQLFSQVKLRKTTCPGAESMTLEVPASTNITLREVRAMLDRADGIVLSGRDALALSNGRGYEFHLRIVDAQPTSICRITSPNPLHKAGGGGGFLPCLTELMRR